MTRAFLGACVAIAFVTGPAAAQVTFHKDVEPVLQKHCQSCHRPGQAGPMSFLTYESARPWARAMKAAVASRKMPPWFANPQYGHFANDRSLPQRDIDTIAQWADAGAPEGDTKDAPLAVAWPSDGWTIQPDLVIDGPAYTVPAKHDTKADVIEWVYVTVPSGITADTWVTSMEIRPSELAVTHHICVYFRPHTDDVVYNTPIWADRPRDEKGRAVAASAGVNGRGIPASVTKGSNGIEGCYVPGQFLQDYRLHNSAKLLKAGTDLVFQLHYTPVDRAVVDRPRLAFTVAKAAAPKTFVTLGMSSPSDAARFAIPPNAANWESPPAEAEFTADVELVNMFPHMHVRGKQMTYTLVFPSGERRVILDVPKYDFNWQLVYDLATPIKVPKGTRLVVTARYDNSAANRFNPDPSATVYYGDMTWEEMMFPFFSVVVDKTVDPTRVMRIVRGRVGDGA